MRSAIVFILSLVVLAAPLSLRGDDASAQPPKLVAVTIKGSSSAAKKRILTFLKPMMQKPLTQENLDKVIREVVEISGAGHDYPASIRVWSENVPGGVRLVIPLP